MLMHSDKYQGLISLNVAIMKFNKEWRKTVKRHVHTIWNAKLNKNHAAMLEVYLIETMYGLNCAKNLIIPVPRLLADHVYFD